MAEQFCEVGRGITLCYEEFGSQENPPLLLIMGLGTQMIAWPDDFCGALAGRGYRVVRFDNRDIGRSTRMTGRPPRVMQLVTRRVNAGYTLSDMALDAVELMRALGMQPAHVVGASMGGMIAQTVAAEHPESVRSLVSIMSNTGSRWRGQPSLAAYRYLLRRAPDDREGFVEHMDRVFRFIGSKGLPQDTEFNRAVAARSYDRGHDPAATGRQLAAIVASGNRTPRLRRISVPTLVVHGTSDPLVRPSGGRATARAIPRARLLKVKGMGHDLPQAAWPQLIDAIVSHARSADESAARVAAADAVTQ